MTRAAAHRIAPRPGRPPSRRRRDDRGSVAVELALGMPLAVLLLFLLVGAFHLGRATVDVNAAAAAASRAASITRTAPAASAAARDSATTNLSGRCASVAVTVDTSQFHRGGAVTVHLACTVTTRGLLGIGLSGAVTISASSTSPLDLYRSLVTESAISKGPLAAKPNLGGWR